MTTYVHRCMIVDQQVAPMARQLASMFGESSQNMFMSPLQPIAGSAEPTHYISCGPIEDVFADMLVSPQALVDGAWAIDVLITPEQAEHVLALADVSEEEAPVALERLGLKRWDDPNQVI